MGIREEFYASGMKILPSILSQLVQMEFQWKQDNQLPKFYDLTSVIGVTGSVNGFIAVSMQMPVAFQSVSNMIGIEAKELNQDVSDAVCEIANNVAGHMKNDLFARGMPFNISVPMLVLGGNFFFPHQGRMEVQKLDFVCPAGAMNLLFAAEAGQLS